jgi:hypothetical protein
MKRRDFGRKIVTGAIGAGLSGSIVRGTDSAEGIGTLRQNSLMHVGGDYHSDAGSGIISRENLQHNLRYGVKHLTATLSKGFNCAWERPPRCCRTPGEKSCPSFSTWESERRSIRSG